MPQQKNQHWVPKHHFRSFTQGRDAIHLLLRSSGQQIFNASIRHQCARNNFYGTVELENLFSKIEGKHAAAIRRAKLIAWSPDQPPLTDEEDHSLLHAVLFQRARTSLEIEKIAPAIEDFSLAEFRHHLAHAPDIEHRDEILYHIDAGDASVKVSPQETVLESIMFHINAIPLIADLQLCVLRNMTDYPFIFSDAPVAFYNMLYRNVLSRGVLGLQTPGLQIFMPLDSRTMLMLIDADSYEGDHRQSDFIDILKRPDVSQLNALQLHHCSQAVYFAQSSDAEYVDSLWRTHASTLSTPRTEMNVRHGWLVDDKPVDQLFQMTQPQLDFRLHLSFLQCTPIRESDFEFRRRRPDVANAYMAAQDDL